MTNVFIVGAGRVGLGLALACKTAHVPVLGLWNRHEENLKAAANFFSNTSHTKAPWLCPGFSEASLIIVALSDSALEGEHRAHDLLEGICTHRNEDCIIAHCSGILPASALAQQSQPQQSEANTERTAGDADGHIHAAAVTTGTSYTVAHTDDCGDEYAGGRHELGNFSRLGSLHPLLPFSSAEAGAVAIPGALFGIESQDDRVIAALQTFVRALAAIPFRIRAEQKPRYHAAAVMASNFVVALLASADAELCALGIEDASAALGHLATHAAQQYASSRHHALTGPLQRGDTVTLKRHLRVLEGETRDIYKILSRKALAITDTLDPEQRRELERILNAKH